MRRTCSRSELELGERVLVTRAAAAQVGAGDPPLVEILAALAAVGLVALGCAVGVEHERAVAVVERRGAGPARAVGGGLVVAAR